MPHIAHRIEEWWLCHDFIWNHWSEVLIYVIPACLIYLQKHCWHVTTTQQYSKNTSVVVTTDDWSQQKSGFLRQDPSYGLASSTPFFTYVANMFNLVSGTQVEKIVTLTKLPKAATKDFIGALFPFSTEIEIIESDNPDERWVTQTGYVKMPFCLMKPALLWSSIRMQRNV